MRINNVFYTGDEYHFRFGIFLSNKRYIEQFNKCQKNLHSLSMNKFACYTPSEYRSILGAIPTSTASKTHKIELSTKNSDDPDTFDWREKGAVNDIKDQGSCGSCWSFSAIAAEEGCYFVSSGNLLRLSEQNLIECVSECHGYGGGMPESAFKYVINSQGSKFALESDYPYAGHDQDCQFDSSRAVAHVSTVKMYTKEDDIQTILLKNGPVSVLIDATAFGFMLYKGGIYEGKDCALFQNHAVTVVGYGVEDDKPFWIVRNSFGTAWGEDGYIRMLKNVNICNIQGTIAGIEI